MNEEYPNSELEIPSYFAQITLVLPPQIVQSGQVEMVAKRMGANILNGQDAIHLIRTDDITAKIPEDIASLLRVWAMVGEITFS